MSKATARTGTHWTAAERAALARLARANTPTGLIAWELKRTEGAVQSQASRQGVR